MYLITRPVDKAEKTSALFKANQLAAYVCPAQKIMMLTPDTSSYLHQYHVAIITSTYAASWFVNQNFEVDHIIAIGNATCSAIKARLPNTNVLEPENSNSEGILSMPAVANISNKTVLIVKGIGGRDLLEQQLSERNAIVNVIASYSRETNISDLLVRQVEELSIKCIIVTSIEIFELLFENFSHAWLREKHWIVASERIAHHMKQRRINKLLCSHGASDTAVLNAAKTLLPYLR